ncbi:actin-related protein [Scheffersomyces xylosifermentans]|uniref:actin-related protein n=1 Tax=Scheffersomyces xylosifermentans TaxID=1304137 RepID=UPI00315D2F94
MSSPAESLASHEPEIKEEDDNSTSKNSHSSSADGTNGSSKKHKPGPTAGKKPSAEVLQRRKEGRIKAAATIAQNLKKTGIGRFEEQNGFGLTSVQAIPLINQKNYFTEYLRKDEQISFVRSWRAEKLQQSNVIIKKTEASVEADDAQNGETTNFDDFDLNNIEAEMNQKKANQLVEDEDDEDDEEENESEEIREEKAKIGHDVIVIHPGSSYIRIGRATDAVPKTIPTVIAVPRHDSTNSTNGTTKRGSRQLHHNKKQEPRPKREILADGEVFFNDSFDEIKNVVTKNFKARMRYYKRRILPNSRETAANYNKKQESEKIPDHNDPYKKEWIDVESPEYHSKRFFVGEDALKLPLAPGKFDSFKLRYPIINGNFNEFSDDYSSPQEILGDIANIVGDSLESMDIRNLSQLKTILIIPDLYDKQYIEAWVDILFKFVGFGRVGIIQESVAATFGAGASCACVVDVGAHTTSISCVDEGMVINDSRVVLNYGGDQVTECFIKLLLESSFPYREIDLGSRVDDWELAQTLKHSFATFQDADIAVQLYNFYKRKPFETTEKFEFKVFDEVMLAPLGYFYPEFFQIGEQPQSIPSLASSRKPEHINVNIKRLFSPSTDQYTGKPDNPSSRSQISLKTRTTYADMNEDDLLMRLCELKGTSTDSDPVGTAAAEAEAAEAGLTNLRHVPLEKAIIESITNAGLSTDLNKIKKLYDNLLIVGGGFAKISGYDLILSDRINIWRPKFLSSSSLDEILDYVNSEIKKTEELRKELTKELKVSKQETPEQNLDEIQLTEKDLESIDQQAQVRLDLDYIDGINEQGSVLTVNVLPPPREFDPEMLTWKGGSVYSRLKVVNEMWITSNDWEVLESRCIYYKSLFNY